MHQYEGMQYWSAMKVVNHSWEQLVGCKRLSKVDLQIIFPCSNATNWGVMYLHFQHAPEQSIWSHFFRKTITIHDLFSGSCSWPILNGAPFKTNFVWSFPISSHDHNGSKYQTHDERCVLGLASNYNIDSSVQLFVHVGEQARLIMPTHFMLSAAANQPEPGNLVTSVKSKFQENISCTNKPIGKLRCHHHHTIADLSLKDRERCGCRPWWWRRVGGGSQNQRTRANRSIQRAADAASFNVSRRKRLHSNNMCLRSPPSRPDCQFV